MGHTPGPWKAEKKGWGVLPEKGEVDAICEVHSWMGTDEAEANLHLIVASPKLLEACKKARSLSKLALDLAGEKDEAEAARISAEINAIETEIYNAIAETKGR